jgi:hypothetical protein
VTAAGPANRQSGLSAGANGDVINPFLPQALMEPLSNTYPHHSNSQYGFSGPEFNAQAELVEVYTPYSLREG